MSTKKRLFSREEDDDDENSCTGNGTEEPCKNINRIISQHYLPDNFSATNDCKDEKKNFKWSTYQLGIP